MHLGGKHHIKLLEYLVKGVRILKDKNTCGFLKTHSYSTVINFCSQEYLIKEDQRPGRSSTDPTALHLARASPKRPPLLGDCFKVMPRIRLKKGGKHKNVKWPFNRTVPMIQWGLWRQMTKDEECFQPTWLCPPLLDQSFWGLGFVSTGFMMMVRDASVSSKFGYGGVPYDDGDDIHDLMIWQKYCPVGKRHWLLRSWEFRSADRCTLRWWRWWQWRRLLWR